MDESDPKIAASAPLSTSESPSKKRRPIRRFFGYSFIVIVVLGLSIRPALPRIIRWYVNQALDRTQVYRGTIGDIDVNIWRGAYSIENVSISKVTGSVPVPLFSAQRVDLQIQWDALLHGKIVGEVVIRQPQVNFVDGPSPAEGQTGSGGPWLQIIRGLFPFKINRASVKDGQIHFRTYQKAQPVDVYLDNLDATVDNLTNISDDVIPLISTVKAKATAMGQARFELDMKLDPFSVKPTCHLAVRLIGLDVTKVNDLARAYGGFDFENGWFDLVVELDAKEGQMAGYVKPLFRNLAIFGTQDLKEDNVIQIFWEALVGVAAGGLSNQSRGQFGTLIPFTGDTSAPRTDILSTIGNVLRNAFVRAYLPRLQNGMASVTDDGLEFGPPEITDPVSAGDGQ